MLGTMKLVVGWDDGLFIMLYTGYALACGLTMLSDIEFVCIAWDSAGVTTGAITASARARARAHVWPGPSRRARVLNVVGVVNVVIKVVVLVV